MDEATEDRKNKKRKGPAGQVKQKDEGGGGTEKIGGPSERVRESRGRSHTPTKNQRKMRENLCVRYQGLELFLNRSFHQPAASGKTIAQGSGKEGI